MPPSTGMGLHVGWHGGEHAPHLAPGKGPYFHMFLWKGLPQGPGWSLFHLSVRCGGSVVESWWCSHAREEGQHGMSLLQLPRLGTPLVPLLSGGSHSSACWALCRSTRT